MTVPTRIGQDWEGAKFVGFAREGLLIEAVASNLSSVTISDLSKLYSGETVSGFRVPSVTHSLLVIRAFDRPADNSVDSAHTDASVWHLVDRATRAALTRTVGCIVTRHARPHFISTSCGAAVGCNRGTVVPQSFISMSVVKTVYIKTRYLEI